MTDDGQTRYEAAADAARDQGLLVPAYEEDGRLRMRGGQVVYHITPAGIDEGARHDPALACDAEHYARAQQMQDRALAFDAETRTRFGKLIRRLPELEALARREPPGIGPVLHTAYLAAQAEAGHPDWWPAEADARQVLDVPAAEQLLADWVLGQIRRAGMLPDEDAE
jgi:hypothetical protein